METNIIRKSFLSSTRWYNLEVNREKGAVRARHKERHRTRENDGKKTSKQGFGWGGESAISINGRPTVPNWKNKNLVGRVPWSVIRFSLVGNSDHPEVLCDVNPVLGDG